MLQAGRYCLNEHDSSFGINKAADSDVDLLVIKPSDQARHLRALPIYRALRGLGVPKDILWVTPDEVAEWGGVVNHVVWRCLKEGRVLYEK